MRGKERVIDGGLLEPTISTDTTHVGDMMENSIYLMRVEVGMWMRMQIEIVLMR